LSIFSLLTQFFLSFLSGICFNGNSIAKDVVKTFFFHKIKVQIQISDFHSNFFTVFQQGDEGTSWYVILKGSVNVVIHGKGVVNMLKEGEDFGQLALVNNAPR